MNWYVAKIIYQIIIGDHSQKPQFDEQLRLIRADEMEWAWEKAQTLGRMGDTIFENDHAENVHWKFIAVENVFPVADLEDGVQLYSNTEEPKDIAEYLTVASSRTTTKRRRTKESLQPVLQSN